MTTSRVAFSSVLDTVAKTANTLSLTVDTISSVLEIGNSYVNRHRTMQVDRNIVELHDFKTRLIEESADRIAERRMTQSKKLENPKFAALHSTAYAEIAALFEPAPEAA